MKKFISLVVCAVLVLSFTVNVSAASVNRGEVISSAKTITEDGLTIVDEVILYPQQARSRTRTADRIRSFYDGDTLIGEIAFRATFSYDGSTVSVVSKSVIQTDTYEGWSYKQNSFTSSGGTVTLDAKLTKLLIFNSSFTMGLSCDVNGNITVT